MALFPDIFTLFFSSLASSTPLPLSILFLEKYVNFYPLNYWEYFHSGQTWSVFVANMTKNVEDICGKDDE